MSAVDRIEAVCPSCGATNRIPGDRVLGDPSCGACKQKIFPREPVTATDGTFVEQVERSPIPVLVDFWAPWCAPCRMVGPILQEMARERAGKLKVVKVNVDENPMIAQRFAVSSIPALKLFRGGLLVGEQLGALPKPALERFVDQWA